MDPRQWTRSSSEKFLEELSENLRVRREREEIAEKNLRTLRPPVGKTIEEIWREAKNQNKSHIAQSGTIGPDRYLGHSEQELQETVEKMIERSEKRQIQRREIRVIRPLTGTVLPSWHKDRNLTNE